MAEIKNRIRCADKRVIREIDRLWQYQSALMRRIAQERAINAAIDVISELYYATEPEKIDELERKGLSGKLADIMRC